MVQTDAVLRPQQLIDTMVQPHGLEVRGGQGPEMHTVLHLDHRLAVGQDRGDEDSDDTGNDQ